MSADRKKDGDLAPMHIPSGTSRSSEPGGEQGVAFASRAQAAPGRPHNPAADAHVRAIVMQELSTSFEEAEFSSWHKWLLQRYFDDPSSVPAPIASPRIPPGSPIGCDAGA